MLRTAQFCTLGQDEPLKLAYDAKTMAGVSQIWALGRATSLTKEGSTLELPHQLVPNILGFKLPKP